MNTIQKHVRIWTRYDAAENVVIVVVQRDLHLLVVGLSVDVHVEGHLGDLEHGQGALDVVIEHLQLFNVSPR